MKPEEKKKICPNCDGSLALNAESCPFCGFSLVSSSAIFNDQFQEENLVSQYTPPYSNKNQSAFEEESKSPFKKSEYLKDSNLGSPTLGGIPVQEVVEEKEEKSSLWPLFFLCAGANLLTIGLIQFFFSDHGVLRLEWNSAYWFVYALGGLSLSFLGFRKIR